LFLREKKNRKKKAKQLKIKKISITMIGKRKRNNFGRSVALSTAQVFHYVQNLFP
jgi:hypothetical protein